MGKVTAGLLLSGFLIVGSAWAHTDLAKTVHPDHTEFDASLYAPFQSVEDGREIKLYFSFPDAKARVAGHWRLDLIDPNDNPILHWYGQTPLGGDKAREVLHWDGLDADGKPLPAGYYTLRLQAAPGLAVAHKAYIETAVDAALKGTDVHLQEQQIQIGALTPAIMPAFAGLPLAGEAIKARPATAGLAYTVYYGNLHAQTNHSDGGASIASCTSSEQPQAGQVDPTGAYQIMRTQAGGDFMLASEHNHMYDGSTNTNGAANPTTALNLFNAGRTAASNYSSANPGFLALYGTEWGVISNGGHINIVNPDGLANWERNSSNQLIGHFEVAKNDYAALYALMRTRNWVGQFNHPSTSQFAIGGTGMALNADGVEVMALTEILNTSAFSKNLTETETSRSTFPGAFNTLLERGYRVAPTSNQDNHCANYGLAYRNRTGVLLPSGQALNQTNFVNALRARRVFAAEDKNAQLILTANDQLMGGSYTNSGTLTLRALYASASGQTAQTIEFFNGVPGRNGTVTRLASGSGTHSYTPALGSHFVYAKVTQANGDRLWSAPVWIQQVAPAVERVVNGGFESGNTTWVASAGVITNSSSRPARSGTWKAWMCGYGASATETLYQSVSIPADATEANWSFWTRIDSAETTTTQVYDRLRVQVRNSSGSLLSTLATYSNLNKSSSYVQRNFNLLAWKGQTVRIHLECSEDASLQTSFVIDDVSLLTR